MSDLDKFRVENSSEPGVLDANIRIRVNTGVNNEGLFMAFGQDGMVIAGASLAHEVEAVLKQFIEAKMAESNLPVQEVTIF